MRAVLRLVWVMLLAIVTPLCAMAAEPPVYAILSLVGNRLDIVVPQAAVGGKGDSKRIAPVPIADPLFDNAIVRAAGDTVQRNLPNAEVVELNTRSQSLFDTQQDLFQEKDAFMSLPDAISNVVRNQKASHLVLISKYRDAPTFTLTNFPDRGVTLEGLGFYLEGFRRAGDADGQTPPPIRASLYAYLTVYLIDASTFLVLKKQTISASATLTLPDTTLPAAKAWEAIPAQTKVRAMDQLIRSEIARVVGGWVKQEK